MAVNSKDLGEIIHERRRMSKLTLHRLSAMSGVSPSHLARIERKERYPSARILHKIAKPLNFDENELFRLAGYLSTPSRTDTVRPEPGPGSYGLDPDVVNVLAQQPFKVQRAVVDILNVIMRLLPSGEEKYSPKEKYGQLEHVPFRRE